jgi:hypothetical protein
MRNVAFKLIVWNDTYGQDLLKYSLMAGLVAFAAAALIPSVASTISAIYSLVDSVFTHARISISVQQGLSDIAH